MSAEERSGWRDEQISGRHRAWGRDAPMMDIDVVYAEYDNHRPVALMEWKLADAKATKGQTSVLAGLADMAGLPAFGVRYYPAPGAWSWRFVVAALNDAGRGLVAERTEMAELAFVELLYRIRGRELPGWLARGEPRPPSLAHPEIGEDLRCPDCGPLTADAAKRTDDSSAFCGCPF